jgi:hypothetical protein
MNTSTFDESKVNRQPGGLPTGGEFAKRQRAEPDIELAPSHDDVEGSLEAFAYGLGVPRDGVDTWIENMPRGGTQTMLIHDTGDWKAHAFLISDAEGAVQFADVYASWGAADPLPFSVRTIPVGGGTRDDVAEGPILDPDWLRQAASTLPDKADLQRRLDDTVNLPQCRYLVDAIAHGRVREGTEPTDIVNVWAIRVGREPVFAFTDRLGARTTEATVVFSRAGDTWEPAAATIRESGRELGRQEARSVFDHYVARMDARLGGRTARPALLDALASLRRA